MGRGAGRTPAQPGRRGRFLELVAAGRAGVRTTGPPPAGGDPLCLAGCGAARGVSSGSGCPGAERGRSLFSNHQVLGCCFNGCVKCPPRGDGPASGHLGASDFPPAELSFRLSERCTWTLTLPLPPTSSQARAAQRPGVTPSGSQAPTSEQNSTCHETVFLRAGGGVVRCKGCWRLAALGPDLASPFSVAWGGVSSRWLSQTAHSRKAGRWAPRRAVLSGGRVEGRRGPGTWTLLYSAPRLAPASRHGVAGFLRR